MIVAQSIVEFYDSIVILYNVIQSRDPLNLFCTQDCSSGILLTKTNLGQTLYKELKVRDLNYQYWKTLSSVDVNESYCVFFKYFNAHRKDQI